MPQKASRTEKRRREGGSQSSLKFQNVPPGITLEACSFNASARPTFYCHWLSTTAVGYRDFYIARIAPQRRGTQPITLISILELATAHTVSRSRAAACNAGVLIEGNISLRDLSSFWTYFLIESANRLLRRVFTSEIDMNPAVDSY